VVNNEKQKVQTTKGISTTKSLAKPVCSSTLKKRRGLQDPPTSDIANKISSMTKLTSKIARKISRGLDFSVLPNIGSTPNINAVKML